MWTRLPNRLGVDHQSQWIETEVCFYCRRVTQELTLWPVGTIGRETDPLVNMWSDGQLGTPLFIPDEIEHGAANTMAPPGPRPPSRSESPPRDVLGSPPLADNNSLFGFPSLDLNMTFPIYDFSDQDPYKVTLTSSTPPPVGAADDEPPYTNKRKRVMAPDERDEVKRTRHAGLTQVGIMRFRPSQKQLTIALVFRRLLLRLTRPNAPISASCNRFRTKPNPCRKTGLLFLRLVSKSGVGKG